MDKSIIIAPIISEKSMKDVALSKFTFRVDICANKGMIKKAIENAFKVNVLEVFTAIVKGKTIRAGTRRTEKLQSAWKKAIVRLKKDQKIWLFDIGGQTSDKT